MKYLKHTYSVLTAYDPVHIVPMASSPLQLYFEMNFATSTAIEISWQLLAIKL